MSDQSSKYRIVVDGSFTKFDIGNMKKKIENQKRGDSDIIIDLSGANKFDSLSVAFCSKLESDRSVRLIKSPELESEIADFNQTAGSDKAETPEPDFTEKLVLAFYGLFYHIRDFIILAADIFYFSFVSVISSKGRKKGSVYEQINLIGNNAVPIVFLLSFLIGLILSLQSAAQLRQFGANIFLVDLIVIAMITEMGPMITAVIVAGRSGSAIAAEISTMKITEELDALKVMALNPLKYVVAPKMLAMTLSLPALTIMANLVGIFGGFIIAVLYLDLSPNIFFDRAVDVMSLNFWGQSILKSVLFSWLIVIIGSHYGFRVKGGAEGVGKATTASVVASIFAVIMTDAFLSLIFYFEF